MKNHFKTEAILMLGFFILIIIVGLVVAIVGPRILQ